MNICTNRLGTFTQHEPPWPYSTDKSYHSPQEFANAGFYNVSTKRSKDKVQCYLCNITLAEWKPGQSPLGRHAHAAKTCPLVLLNFPDTLTTIPIVEKDTNTHPESDFMIKTRLKTFTKSKAWPPSLATMQSAPARQSTTQQRTYPTSTKMAEAGFIFLPTLNEPDRVKCPYCQYCLSDLNVASNPWALHQRARPECLYVTRRRVGLPVKRSSLPQKRTIPAKPSTSTTKKPRRATTNSHNKENTTKPSDDHDNGITTTDNNNDNNNINNNEAGDLSRFDDSIWDIAKAQMKIKQPPDLATTNHQRPANAKPLVTYEKKKQKKLPSKVLPPELTKPTVSTNAKRSSSSSSRDTATTPQAKKQHQQQAVDSTSSHKKQDPTTSNAARQRKSVDETPAQVLFRLQKTPVNLNTPKDKGKSRAIDSTPAIETSQNASVAGKRRSLRKNAEKVSTQTTSSLSSSSNAVAASVGTSMIESSTSQQPTNSMTNEPLISNQTQEPFRFFASTPSTSSLRRSKNFTASTPLAHSTPIHMRTDHGNDLMALTLSPIRGVDSNSGLFNANHLGGTFGSLDTPMTTSSRMGQPHLDLDIGQQIEQRFKSHRRRLGSPTSRQNGNDLTFLGSTGTATTKALFDSPDFATGTPLLDFDPSDDEVAAAEEKDNANGSGGDGDGTGDGSLFGVVPQLTNEQLKMTVEQFIQNLVESKVDTVKRYGEKLIKCIEEEVADTKKSIRTNQ